jgi:predicted CXXCH cytochrome family protein
MMRTLRFVATAALLAAAGVFGTVGHAGVAATKHNLSVSGPGTVKAATESEICIFCHAPHNTAPTGALWNRRAPASTYTPYTSSTSRGSAGQPNGASLLCLSCHDGTIALGELLSRAATVSMSGGVTTMPAGTGRLGTDLSDDHPVSFAYTAALVTARGGELVNPTTLTGKVKLDASGQMQCTSCHDPHDDANGKFLVTSNAASALCQTCHTKNYWAASSHRLSTRAWNGTLPDPWPHTSDTTVAANACENCHQPHSAAGKKWLLNTANEEDTCLNCHNGNAAQYNIGVELVKTSAHAVAATTGIHDPAEPVTIGARHVECSDCHNPHATKATGTGPPGSLTGARGVSITGTEVNPVTDESQVCFRCHADSTGKPAPRTARLIAQTNTRLEFSTTNPSHHAIAGPGKNTSVPSLIAPLTTASTITCGSCHNNNAGPGAGGTGPKGPHGSTYTPLLERQYVVADNTAESAANYALCYKCHSRTSIIGNGTGSFKDHNKHIVGAQTPCNVCHDPHGISSTQGNAVNNAKLINFDTSVVRAVSASVPIRFVVTGANKGSCYLVCHGKSHNPESY